MGGDSIIEKNSKVVLQYISNKKVLFITTKNLDYIRNTQEINLIEKASTQCVVIGFYDKSYIKRIVKIFLRLISLNVKQFDMIFLGFAPQLVLPFWNWKFRKREIVIDFFISMYDTFVNDRKKCSSKSLIAKILLFLDKKTLHCTDYIITDTKAHAKYFIDELGADASKINTLYLEADTSIYYPRCVKKPHDLSNKFVVLYFGSILPLQGIDIVLKAFELLKDNEQIYMYMIGKIGNQYEKPVSDNIRYIDWLSQEELADYIGMADLCLAGHFNKNVGKAKRTIPGKTYIYRAMGKKIILGDNAANRELFDERESGIYFVEMGNAQLLAHKIEEICKEDCLNGLS